MDAKGRSIDNIVIEKFWRTLKYENVYPSSYTNIKEARGGITKEIFASQTAFANFEEYINIYNRERLHSVLDYLTPDEVYYKGVNNRCYNAKEVILEVV